MAIPAVKLEWEKNPVIEERVARLESNIEHIKTDVSEMKLDIREMRHDIAGLRGEIGGLELRTEKSLAALSERINESFAKVHDSIASLKIGRVADRVGWLLTAGVILGVMARGFGWL
jgi:hypothetical protein